MSSNRAAIKKIENSIAVLSKEDQTKNEQVTREFESFREYLLHNINEEDEEEEEYVDLQLLEKKRVVKVIMDLLSFDDEHHQSAFTPGLLDNLQDVVDPMLLLSDNDLNFIHTSVMKLYDCSYDYAILGFCKEAKEWLQRPTDSDDDDDVPNGDDDVRKITVLREHFSRIISARDEKVKLNRIKQREVRAHARALALVQSYNNNLDRNTNSYDESTQSDKDSDSDEEKQEKSPILEINREEELYDDHGRQSNSSDKKRFRESDEKQEKSSVLKSLKFEHDGEDARVKGEDVRAK